MESSKTGQHILSIFGNKENELKLTPQGRAIGSMLSEYHRLRNISLDESNKTLKPVYDWHKQDDTVRNSLPLDKATVQQLHAHASSTGHPVTSALAKIIQDDPAENPGLTLKELTEKNKSKARLTGMAGSVGLKMENVSPLMASMLDITILAYN